MNLYLNSLNLLIKGFFGTFLSALFGILLSRAISNDTGPEGLGEFGIYKQFFNVISTIITCGGGMSIIEHVSKGKDNIKSYKETFSYCFIVTIFTSLILYLFSENISFAIFSNDLMSHSFQYSFAFIFFSLPVLYLRPIFSALGWTGYASFVQVIQIAILLATYLILRNFFIKVDLLHLYIITYFFCFIIIFFIALKKINFYFKLEITKFTRIITFERTSLITFLTTFFSIFTILVVKSFLVRINGLEIGGILEAVWTLCWYVPLLISPFLSSVYLPKVSRETNISKLIFQFFNISLSFSFVGFLLLYIFKKEIINLFYGEKFGLSLEFVSYFVLAEFIRMSNIFFQYTLIGISHKRYALVIEAFSSFFFIVLTYICLNQGFGLLGLAFCYLFYQIIIFSFYSIYIYEKKICTSIRIFLHPLFFMFILLLIICV